MLVGADEPPGHSRGPTGLMLDPLEPVLRRLLEEWPEIRAPRVTEPMRDDYGYTGSVDLVRKRLAELRPGGGIDRSTGRRCPRGRRSPGGSAGSTR